MSNRLQPGLSVVTLVIAVLGWTPVGQAAGAAIANVVPFAKVAGFAKNAGALNGHSASRRPKAGQIPILSTSGKLPASIGAVGPAGATGAAGPAGPSGVSGYQQVAKSVTFSANGADTTVSCPGGKSVVAGGYNLGAGNDNLTVFDSHPVSASDWRFRIKNTTQGTGLVTVYAVCATVTS